MLTIALQASRETSPRPESTTTRQLTSSSDCPCTRLIIRVAGICAWCISLGAILRPQHISGLVAQCGSLDLEEPCPPTDHFIQGYVCPVSCSILIPAGGPDIISDSALRRGEPQIMGNQAPLSRFTFNVDGTFAVLGNFCLFLLHIANPQRAAYSTRPVPVSSSRYRTAPTDSRNGRGVLRLNRNDVCEVYAPRGSTTSVAQTICQSCQEK